MNDERLLRLMREKARLTDVMILDAALSAAEEARERYAANWDTPSITETINAVVSAVRPLIAREAIDLVEEIVRRIDTEGEANHEGPGFFAGTSLVLSALQVLTWEMPSSGGVVSSLPAKEQTQ